MTRRVRLDRLAEALAWLGVLGFVALAIGPALLGRGVLADVDYLRTLLPWRVDGSAAGTSALFCRGDTLDSVLPAMQFGATSLREGTFPTWSPYEAGGTPFAAKPDYALLSPLSWPYLLLPLWLAPAFVKLTEFAVAIAGMVAFLGRHGVRRPPALLAGVVFAGSGFMVMWTNWPQTRVAALIPALFWALERVAAGRGPRDVAWLGLVVASMLLGGFPAVTLFALSAGAVYVVVRGVQEARRAGGTSWRVLLTAGGCAAGGVGLGAALPALQLLPFARDLDTLGLSHRPFGGVPLPTGAFVTTIAPSVHGLCRGGDWVGPLIPIERTAFIGGAALLLAVCAVLLRRGRDGESGPRGPAVLLGLLFAGTVAAVFVDSPLVRALGELPFYSSNLIWRATSVVGFLGAALAGIGLDRLASARRGRPRAVTMLAALAVVAVSGGFLAWTVREGREDAAAHDIVARFDAALRVPLVLGAGAVVCVVVALLARGWLRAVALLLVGVLVVGQTTAFARAGLPLSQRANFYPATATHLYLQQHRDGQRYAAGDWTTYPATADYYGLRTPVGHQFVEDRWGDLLRAVDPEVFLTPTFTRFSASVDLDRVASDPVLDRLAVRYWVTPSIAVAGTPDRGRPDGTVTLTEGTPLSCVVPGGPLAGIAVGLPQRPDVVPGGGRLHVRVMTPAGPAETSRPLGRDAVGPTRVAVVGDGLPADPVAVEVWATGLRAPLVLDAAGGSPLCRAVRPDPGGLRLAHAATGALVYERPTALPRIRWAGTSRVVPVEEQVADLAAGLPADTVLLDSPDAPAADGATGTVEVIADDPGRIRAEVTASGTGYLVVADALRRAGWHATVDGEPASIETADHAFGGVAVPAGTHVVELRYHAPGLRAGAVVSVAALLVTAVLFLAPWIRRRVRVRRRRTTADT